jgi:lysophospholipase L1-like esterase
MSKAAVQTALTQKVLLVLGSSLLMLVLLGTGELYCRWFTRINFVSSSGDMFISRKFGGSYGNASDYEGISFGTKFQTDQNGFRIDPTFRDPTSNMAVLILGDSVAFGPGVEEPKTFVGLLRRSMPNVRFYNSSVIGYGLHDYANVVDQFVPLKPEIKYVLLFYCLNDIYDVSAQQILQSVQTDTVTTKPSLQSVVYSINVYLRERSKLYLFVKDVVTNPSMRYFKQDLAEYQKGNDHIAASLRPLKEIGKKLAARGITFKVFVMPYKAQVQTMLQADLLPQRIVDDFLRRNEIDYNDAAEKFMNSGFTAEDLYLYGDPMHLSEKGHRLVSKIVGGELTKIMRWP